MITCKEEDGDSQTVLLLHYFTGNLSSGISKLSDVVNNNQKKFNLVTTPMEHEEFKVSIRTQLDGKYPPDLFSYWAGSRTKFLVDNDKVLPITSLFKDRVDSTQFDKSVMDACSYNDEVYLLPITRHYIGFFYNKKVFQDLGVEIPNNWSELLVAADKIKQGSVTPFALGAKNRWPAQFWFDYLLLRSAGFHYRERLMNNNASYSDTEVLKAIELWKELVERDFFSENMLENDWDKAALEVVLGSSAMTLMGTWIIPILESEGLKPSVDYDFFSFPIIDPQYERTSLGPIDGILLSKGSRSSSLANDVLFQLAQAETQEAFNAISGAIAPHLFVNNDIYNPIQVEIKKLIKENRYWAFNYDLATSPKHSEAGLNFFIEFLREPGKYKDLLTELDSITE